MFELMSKEINAILGAQTILIGIYAEHELIPIILYLIHGESYKNNAGNVSM